jgi:hypothetical protein
MRRIHLLRACGERPRAPQVIEALLAPLYCGIAAAIPSVDIHPVEDVTGNLPPRMNAVRFA